MIIYYSANATFFETKPKIDSKMRTISTKMDESNFKTIKRTRISYIGKNNKHIIKLDDKSCFKSCSCNCKTFIKFGICPHLLAFSSINNLNIYESHSSVDKFVQKTKKGRKGRNKLAGKALAFD